MLLLEEQLTRQNMGSMYCIIVLPHSKNTLQEMVLGYASHQPILRSILLLGLTYPAERQCGFYIIPTNAYL